MTYWIFKLSNQESYPDDFGRTYVYDNRHSVRVTANDFLPTLISVAVVMPSQATA